MKDAFKEKRNSKAKIFFLLVNLDEIRNFPTQQLAPKSCKFYNRFVEHMNTKSFQDETESKKINTTKQSIVTFLTHNLSYF